MMFFEQKRVIVHIGLPRCGSTLLQRDIFPQLSGDVRVVTPATADRRLIDFLLEHFIFSGRNVQLSPVTNEERVLVQDIMSEYPEAAVLISCEGLVGDVFENMLTLPHLTEALRGLFGQPDVLLIIRRQSELVKSYYRHAIEDGYYKRFSTFTGFQDENFAGFRLGRFSGLNVNPTGIDYWKFVTYLDAAFGKDKVHVLPFEWIAKDFRRFYEAISRITGGNLPPADGTPAVVNSGRRNGDIALLRALNRAWDSRILGIPLLPKLNLLEHYERARSCRSGLNRIVLAVAARISPLGVLNVLGPVLSPLLTGLFTIFKRTDLNNERVIVKTIDDAMFESNAALNVKLGGILTGLGYCDR